MTFSEILADVYRAVGEPSSPATATVTRIKANVNEGLRILYSDPVLKGYLLQNIADTTTSVTLTSVASQARYVVRDAAAKILRIADRTNDYVLQPMSLDDYRLHSPDPNAYTGTPTHYVDVGRVGAEKLPSNASQIFAKSSDGADTTQTIHIRFIRTGGTRVQLSVALNGTTAANLGSTWTDLIEIQDIFLTAVAAGTVTVHEDSGAGTELAAVPRGALRPRLTGIYLWPTPAAAVDYAVDFRYDISDLTQDNDEPLFPTDFHYLLSLYAQRKHWIKADDSRAQDLQAMWVKGVADLKYFLASRPYDIPVAGRVTRIGHSRLGGYYPADYWR